MFKIEKFAPNRLDDPANWRLPEQPVPKPRDRRKQKKESRAAEDNPPERFARTPLELVDAVAATGVKSNGWFYLLWILQARHAMGGGKPFKLGNVWLAKRGVTREVKHNLLSVLVHERLIAIKSDRHKTSPIIQCIGNKWWLPG